jgi:hypothetical protein
MVWAVTFGPDPKAGTNPTDEPEVRLVPDA